MIPSQSRGLSNPAMLMFPPKPATRGEFDELAKKSFKKNRVTPIASRLIATPTTT